MNWDGGCLVDSPYIPMVSEDDVAALARLAIELGCSRLAIYLHNPALLVGAMTLEKVRDIAVHHDLPFLWMMLNCFVSLVWILVPK